MTWTLDNGTIVLQNFVNKDEARISQCQNTINKLYSYLKDCTADKIDYWGTDYLNLVWNMTGTAECCYTDGCNDNREEKPTTATSDTTTSVTHTTAPLTSSQAESIEDSQDKDNIEEGDDDLNFPVDCSLCDNIMWSVCVSDPSRKNIQNIGSVAVSRPQNSLCSCMPGFLPLYMRQILVKCVDPIIKTSSVMGRCLVAEHCSTMPGTECSLDPELAVKPGFEFYQTCQCMDSYKVRIK